MRPRGTVGEISKALLSAASAGPAPVRELAYRSQVGVRAATYTCHRLVNAGELVVLHPGRPAVLARSTNPVPLNRPKRTQQEEALDALARHWWD